MKKVLIIDDNLGMVKAFQMSFAKNPNVTVVRCQSVEEGLKAVEANKPDIIFLDHSLTTDGDEGLEIADTLKAARNTATIYSITGGNRGLEEYEKRGIEIIPKYQVEHLKAIVSQA